MCNQLPEPTDVERVLLTMERLLLDPPETALEERRQWANLAAFCNQRMEELRAEAEKGR